VERADSKISGLLVPNPLYPTFPIMHLHNFVSQNHFFWELYQDFMLRSYKKRNDNFPLPHEPVVWCPSTSPEIKVALPLPREVKTFCPFLLIRKFIGRIIPALITVSWPWPRSLRQFNIQLLLKTSAALVDVAMCGHKRALIWTDPGGLFQEKLRKRRDRLAPRRTEMVRGRD